jgi:hypothetical protein
MKTGKPLNRTPSCFFSILLLVLLTCPAGSFAQRYDTGSIFSAPVQLDSVTFKSGFDIKAFIRRVQADTTFYKAFKSMRLVPYKATNDIRVYDKDTTETASLHSTTKQNIKQRCRTMQVIEQKTTGDFFKRNGDYRYYTAELYDYLFFTREPVCNENDRVAGSMDAQGKGQKAKSEYQLKQLIFNPGSRVSGVPFMGDRASIFEPGEAEKYNFKIVQEQYNGTDCYVFKITPKAGYEHSVIYNELTTWFRKSDYSILARNYSLSYHTLVYDFDVTMKVRTTQVGGKLYPTYISYDGNWHVFTKKRERVKFSIAIEY